MLTFAPLNEAWTERKKAPKESKVKSPNQNSGIPKGFVPTSAPSGGPVVAENINDVVKVIINDPEVISTLQKYTDVYVTDITRRLLKQWINGGEKELSKQSEDVDEKEASPQTESFVSFPTKGGDTNEFVAYAIVGIAALVLFDSYIKRSCKNT